MLTTSDEVARDPYRDAVERLQARGRFGIRLGLGRTTALLRALGDPQREFRGALIGGTNGKGSVQALVAAVLRRAGYRVGQTPKPHLVSYRERVVVDGEPIGPDAFAQLVSEVIVAADRLAKRLGPPTEFEVLTAAALAWFARQRVDVAVVEVGLGGRLDATNAWDGGVAAITNVDWDHMDRLGDTLQQIAREKAPIIKRGDRAVTGASDPALSIIRRRARRMAAPLTEVLPLPVVGMTRAGLSVRHPALGELRLGLLGRHQAANAAVAVAVLDALREAGIATVTDQQARDGLLEARWPGRLELLALLPEGRAVAASPDGPERGCPDVLLDGAHNVAGATALAAALEELRPTLSPGRPTVLVGIARDKDVAGVVAPLARSALDARIIATRAPSDRALPAQQLAALWAHATTDRAAPTPAVRAVESLDEALGEALASCRADDGPLVVAGSLYLVGAVRARLVQDESPQDPV